MSLTAALTSAAAEREVCFRRTGMFISLAVIALAMLALIFKIRAMEKQA